MGVITEPKVYLVSQTKFNDDMFYAFLRDEGIEGKRALVGHNDTECVVEAACRLCYMSYGKGAEGYKVFPRQHYRVKAWQCIRACELWLLSSQEYRASLTHELIRHRAGFAYSQLKSSDMSSLMSWISLSPRYIWM